jgi:hypothetical protein
MRNSGGKLRLCFSSGEYISFYFEPGKLAARRISTRAK